jgi:hypothetical protein
LSHADTLGYPAVEGEGMSVHVAHRLVSGALPNAMARCSRASARLTTAASTLFLARASSV